MLLTYLTMSQKMNNVVYAKILDQILFKKMKECDLCNNLDVIHYTVRSIKHKLWFFCCKKCWYVVSKESQYSYGGTRKQKHRNIDHG